MPERIQIPPNILRWAVDRAGLGEEELEKKFPKFSEWEGGELAPTIRQLQKFAIATFTPFGYFFLPKPPTEELPIPDFRTLEGDGVRRPSPHLLDTIYAVQRRQAWMREYLIEKDEEPLDFVGSVSVGDVGQDALASLMHAQLGLSEGWAEEHSTWEEALRALVHAIEGIGVLVMVSGIVGNNTRRKLDVEEFRGFALCDNYAPTIFVNGADAKAAQMFTLIHELAHLWTGSEGLSALTNMIAGADVIEKFCDAAAAEFLIPAHSLKREWIAGSELTAQLERLARRFKISQIVVARRALDIALINREEFLVFYKERLRYFAERKAVKKKGGGDFYRTTAVRLGQRFARAIYGAAREGRLSYGDAYQLTGLSGNSYDRFGEKLGVRT